MEILQIVAWLQWTVCSELCSTLVWSIPGSNNSLFHWLFWGGKFQTIRLLLFFFSSFCSTFCLTFSSFTPLIVSAHAALPVTGRENLNFCGLIYLWLENTWCTDRKETTGGTLILETLSYKWGKNTSSPFCMLMSI